MANWWRIGQDIHKGMMPTEAEWRWEGIVPGDIVQANGSQGYMLDDLPYRFDDKGTKVITVRSTPMLVLSLVSGSPEDSDSPFVTFTCLHPVRGIIVFIMSRPKEKTC